MFIDHVIIEVAGGHGGSGCVSFRREKFVPRGGPDGGDGGRGGHVVVEASSRLTTLVDLHYHRHYRGGRGQHGEGNNRTGKSGEDVVVYVPPGTVIIDVGEGSRLAELLEPGARHIVARGGAAGRGNVRFKSSRRQAPTKATPGQPGEERRLEITLKLIADVGLVGAPNAGKSTLLSVLSAARPKVAAYPFTTKTPVLGIVKTGDFDGLVMVDIPGLIEGAHEGKGMGKEFLRHIERCRALVYLIDVTDPDPETSYRMLRGEILRYDSRLLEKPSIVAFSKCDLLEGGIGGASDRDFGGGAEVYPISAVSGEGLGALVGALRGVLG